MNGFKSLRLFKKFLLPLLLATIVPLMAGAYNLAWCLHPDNSFANHLFAEITTLKVSHGCDAHEGNEKSRPSMGQADTSLHISFTSQAAVLRVSPAGSFINKELLSRQGHAMSDLASVVPTARLFCDRLPSTARLPNDQIAALRTIVLRN